MEKTAHDVRYFAHRHKALLKFTLSIVLFRSMCKKNTSVFSVILSTCLAWVASMPLACEEAEEQ